MIHDAEVLIHLTEHEQRVRDLEPLWKRMEAAWNNEYWGPYKDRDWVASSEKLGLLFEKNRMRPWATSVRASLFYRKIAVEVEEDLVMQDEGITEEETVAGEVAVKYALERFFRRKGVISTMRDTINAAITYHWCALKIVDSKGKHPLDRLGLEFLPPWEVGWDPDAKSWEQARFFMHVYTAPAEQVVEHYGLDPDDVVRVRADQDVGAVRTRPKGDDAPSGYYVRVLEFWDLTGKVEFQNQLDGSTETTRGEHRVYLVDSVAEEGKQAPMRRILAKPIPYHDHDGRPVCPIVPVLADNLPGKQTKGASIGQNVYEHNGSENLLLTGVIQAALHDIQRIVLYDETAMDKETVTRIATGVDKEYVGIPNSGGRPLKDLMHEVVSTPVASSVLEALRQLEAGLEQTQGTAPFTRGEPTRYITATQSDQLLAYTETMIGELKHRLNTTLVDVAHRVLRMLYRTVRKPVKIRQRVGEPVTLDRGVLDRWFDIEVTDVASTPADEASRRQTLPTVAKLLLELSGLAAAGDGKGQVAQRLYSHALRVFDMPNDLAWDNIYAEAVEAAHETGVAEGAAEVRGEGVDTAQERVQEVQG